MYKYFVFVIVILSLTQAAERPGANFLLIWPGARATAMAGAFSAVADDATACYYNQAGLAFINRTMLTFQHAPWLPGLHESVYYEYFSIVTPFKTGALGLHVACIYETSESINFYPLFYPGYHRFFGLDFSLCYGQNLKPNLGIGFGSKIVYNYLVPIWLLGRMPELGIGGAGIALSWAIDAGVLYKPLRPLCLSLGLQNFGPNLKYTESGASDPLPHTLRLGMKIQAIETKKIQLILTSEATKILVGMFADSTLSFTGHVAHEIHEAWKAVGLEIGYLNVISLRCGYLLDNEGRRSGLTYGGGITIKHFSIDIGFDHVVYDFETGNYKVSLSYQF